MKETLKKTTGGESARRLDLYQNAEYDPLGGIVSRVLWYYVSLMFMESAWLPISRFKVWILRRFGAKIGQGVVIKPNVRIKYPWRLRIGDYAWIGQDAWIDNLENVSIGSHCVLSQGCYLCTGSHDRHKPTFDLIVKPIQLHDGAWVGAGAIVLQGVTLGVDSVVSAGSVVSKDVPANTVHR